MQAFAHARLLFLVASGLLWNLGAVSHAAEVTKETSVLDLVPRDAGGFIHIRFADVWKHDSLKPVRDFLLKTDPQHLKEFEKSFGFLPADIETVTLIFPDAKSLDFPIVVVRATQPFDKAKVLKAMKLATPEQMLDQGFGHAMPAPVIRKEAFPPKFKEDFKVDPKPAPFPDPKPDPRPEPKLKENNSICDPKEEEPDDEPFDRFARPLPKPDLRARHYIGLNGGKHLFVIDDRTVALANSSHNSIESPLTIYGIQMLRRVETGPLDAALAEAKKRTFVAAVNGSELAKLAVDMPAKMEKYRPLFAAKSAMLTIDLAADLKAILTVDGGTFEQAKKIEDSLHALIGETKGALPDLRKDAKKSPTGDLILVLLDQGEKALAKVAVEQKDALVLVTTSITPDAAFEAALKIAMAKLTVGAERMKSSNNLKQMGIAIHAYHDANGRLPFPGVGRNGAPLGQGNMNPNLSWRVAILPYVEQGNLYRQFKLDEPWDSEHNKALIPKMPKIYAPVNGIKAERGHTFYQIFTGREAFRSGMTLQGLTDGLSNTLMIVESGDAVPWTRPEDMLYDSKKPLAKLGGLFNGDFNALFADGSVRYISKSIAEKTLRALITPQGGEVIEDFDK